MNLKGVIFLCVFALCCAKDCSNVKRINSKLICYYSKLTDVDHCYCTHIILPANTDVKLIKNLKEKITGAKILLTVNEFNEGLVTTVKENHIDGLELNLKKLSTKDDIAEFISTVRTKLGNNLFLALSIPPKTELLAKYYDLKSLTKTTDLFILQTSFLGASKNVTFHPSRLSGLWDMQNTDSVVDLVTGLGAPLSRLVVSAPVQAFQFTLQDDSLTTPGSPALELKTIPRKELCERMRNKDDGSWILERDQDQAGPYIFKGKEWIAFEDATSMDIKAKYTRVRGLGGLALKDLSQDIAKPIVDSNNNEEIICDSLLLAAHAGLSKQTRAPRQAVLRSLERDILETHSGHLSSVNVSPYRITRIVDVEGHVHSVRKDTRTEFECSRQGYFVHPHSCGRFYRCVKFDQLVDEFSVFEFDCPAGLVFDERVEVCVWPGNLPDGAPCHGSSEIAPVPKNRFNCPGEQGYFADPENCRWFFACLDHGKSGLTAYEFRCPFGLVFDEKRLLCEWPWLVPTCGSGHISGLELDNIEFYGGAAKSTIIPGNGGHKIVNVQLQPQVNVVSSGAHLLDIYDGLGSLGAISLGGYNGDLGVLKQNIHLQSGYNNVGNLAYVSNQNLYQSGLGHSNEGQFGSLTSGYQSIDFGAKLNGASFASSGEVQNNNGAAYSLELNKQSQFDGSSANTVLVDSGATSHAQFGLLANAGLSAGSSLQYNSDLQKTNQGEHYQTIQQSVPIKVTEVSAQPLVELQGHKYSGSLDYNYQYANEANYNIQPVVTHTSHVANVGVVDKQNNDAVLLNNANSKYNTATSISYANKLSHNIADLSTHGESVLTALPVEKTDFNLAVTPRPDFYSIVGQQKSIGYSSVHQVQQPLITEIKTPVIQQTVVPIETHKAQSGSSYSSFNQYHTPAVQYEQKIQPIVTEFKTPAIEVKQPSYSSSYNYQTPVVHHVQKVQPLVEVKTPILKQNTYSSSYNYQTPVVQYEQKVQPIISEIRTPVVQETVVPVSKVQQSGYSSSYQYQAPAVHYEQKVQPIVSEIRTPVVQETVVPVSKVQQSGYSSSYHYQAPAVHYEQKVQPIVTEYKAPVVQETFVPESKVQQSGYSSSYQYQAPAVQYEQKVQPIVTEIKTPVVQETIVPVSKVQQSGYSSSYHYQAPTVHYEQKQQPIVTEIRTPVVQETVVPVSKVQQSGYSSSYHYQAPAVQYEQKVQPIVTEIKTPIVQQTIVPEVKQTGYSSSYHYQAPAVQYEQKIQPVVTEIKTPLVQETVVPVSEVKQTGYSSSYHYQAPAVQYEQKLQPIEIKTPVVHQQTILPVKQTSYHYQAPVVQYEQKVQPIVTEIKTPVVQQEVKHISSYQYQTPVVHYEQKVQPVVTEIKTQPLKQTTYSSSYHYQAPQVKYENVQPLVEIKTQPQEVKQSYSSYQYQSPVVQYEQKVQPLIQVEKQTVVPLQQVKHSSYSSGYQYQAPVQEYKQVIQPVVTEYKTPVIQKETGYSSSYHYQAPSVQYKEVQPVVTEVKTPVVQQTYHYQQPAVKVQPIEIKTPIVKQETYYQPAIQYEQKVQPVVQKQTYYQAPQVQYEQKAQSHSQFYGVQHNVQLQQQPQIVQTVSVTPKYETVSVTPQYENHQYYDKRVHEVKLPVVQQPSAFVSVSPKYETQSIQPISYEGRVPVVEEKIVPVKAYQTYTSHSQTNHVQKIKTITEAPVVNTYLPSKPIVNTYYVSTPKPQIYKAPEVYVSSTPKYSVFQEFVQPKQTFEIKKKVVSVTPTYETYSVPQKTETYVQPQQIVETYNYNAQPIKQDIVYTTEKPKAYLPPKVSQYYVSSTPKYQEVIEVKKPASPTVISQYEYVNPEYANYESKLNINFDHFNNQPTNAPVEQYHTQTAFYSTQEQQLPQVVPVEKYQTDFVVSTPKPTFISTIAPVVKQTPIVRTKVVALDKYKTYDDQYFISNPKQFYVSTPAPVIKTEDSLPPFRYYDSRLDTAVKQTDYYNQYDDYVVSTDTPKVSTIRPIVQRKKIASTTTPIPLDIYDDYSDVNYGSQYLVEVKPSTFKPKVKQYVVSSTTEAPLNFYYEDKVKSTVRPVLRKKIVSTTTERYVESTYRPTSRPIVKKKKIVVTTTTSPAPVEYNYDEYVVSSENPKYESIKITPRPKGKTVVRVNDFHPFLTTKLGAQCTCVSNTVKLRKGSKQKEVEEFDYELPENVPVTKLTKSGPSDFDDYNEPGVYVVGNSDIDDDYEYGLRKVSVTKTPEVVIKSTTNAVQPAPTPEYSHRRRITTARPSIDVEVTSISNKLVSRTRTSTSRVEEVFLSSSESPALNKRVRTKSKEQKIVEAVNEGLSLVKSTVKSAVKEAISEENRNFDRYGPGGWRSRGETLQGSVDCQREGLFRHPTQCNKFYACRWDCTKQRYTLHVFNCPVHLTFDTSQGACNWPSKGPACTGNTLLPSS